MEVGVLEQESQELNKRFIFLQEKKRPFVLLKWAQTADGFIDRLRKDSSIPALRISNDITGRLVHKMRAENMAIMVGTSTVLLDNPSLTVRHGHGSTPVRIIVDRNDRIPADAVVKSGEVQTLILQ